MNCPPRMTAILYEYFQYNMGKLDGFYCDKDVITKSRTYILEGQTLPHYLNQEEINGEFYYYPSEPISIGDAIHSKQEVVCFSLEVLRSDCLLRKDYISDTLAIVEKYDCSSGLIEARIYDIESLIEQLQNIQDTLMTSRRRFIEYLMQEDMNGPKEVISVSISENNDGTGYVIEDYVVGEGLPKEIVASQKPLYPAYYNYMVEKGYFAGDESTKKDDSAKIMTMQSLQ